MCVFAQVLSRSKQCQQFPPLHVYKSNPSSCAVLMACSADEHLCAHVSFISPPRTRWRDEGSFWWHHRQTEWSFPISLLGWVAMVIYIVHPGFPFMVSLQAWVLRHHLRPHTHTHASQLKKMTHHGSDALRLFLLLGKHHYYWCCALTLVNFGADLSRIVYKLTKTH